MSNPEEQRERLQAVAFEADYWTAAISELEAINTRVGNMTDIVMDISAAALEATINPHGGSLVRAAEGARAILSELLPTHRSLYALIELAGGRVKHLQGVVDSVRGEVEGDDGYSVRVDE